MEPRSLCHLFLLFVILVPRQAVATLLIGAGSILPAGAISDAQFAYRFVQPITQVQFYLSEAGAGKCRIMNYTAECSPTDKRAPNDIDFALGTSSPTAENFLKYPDLQMYPTVVTALVPIYNLNGSQGLSLTRTVLAKIFCGQIRTWDDPQIVATNPNFSSWNVPANQSIEVVVRRENADLTVVFKRAMLAFWSEFTKFADLNVTSTWGSALITRKDGYESVNTYVLQTPWTLAFSAYGNARDCNSLLAKMVQSSGAMVEASQSSITYAVLEMGLSFGNNGEDPTRLTADLSNAQGVNAWPIVTYMYLILRKSTLRNGATCANVKENVAFWKYFLSADVMEDILKKRYFVQIPTIVRDVILQRLTDDVTCLGARVYKEANTTEIVGAGESSLSAAFVQLARVYPLYQSNTSITYNAASLNSASSVEQGLSSNRFVVVRQSGLQPATGTAMLLFAGVALVVISQYNLTLDGPTLVRILEGDIKTWLHPDIVALNPFGMVDTGGAKITNANQTIMLINGPTSATATYWDLMQRLSSNYSGRALQAADYYDTEELLRYVVAGTPFSLSVSVFSGDFSARLQFAKLQGASGIPAAPSTDSIRACASSDVYNAASNSFTLSQSASPSCYLLSEATYLIARKPQCGSPDQAAADAAVAFVDWIFHDGGLSAALQDQHLALLHNVSSAVKEANAIALQSLVCITAVATEPSTDILPILLGACLGGFFVVVVPVAWYIWRSTKEMRALRKQFSDVKVAQECAEAIACFNLDAVSWLSTVQNPSKVQLAFLNIISLLVEVKPFIPDQLMAELQKGHTANGQEESPRPDGNDTQLKKCVQEEALTIATSESDSSSCISPQSRITSPVHAHDMGGLRVHQVHAPASRRSISRSISSPRGPRIMGRGNRVQPQAEAAGLATRVQTDHFFRTCTYLFVRFSLSTDSNHAQLAPRLTSVAAHVVTLAKAHGATIDRVAYDSVSAHWNGSLNAASAPMQATQLALELAKAGAILPQEAQAGFRLLVGIGHGLCHVATVSAAGQRFFVVGGPEVMVAVDAVMQQVAVPLGCTILVSNAVHQEVQYSFNCFPRRWFQDTLLWEPVEMRKSASVSGEWMYELQQMEQRDEHKYGGRLLQEVFLLARNEKAHSAALERIQKIQATYTGEMSQQDAASLRWLARSLDPPLNRCESETIQLFHAVQD